MSEENKDQNLEIQKINATSEDTVISTDADLNNGNAAEKYKSFEEAYTVFENGYMQLKPTLETLFYSTHKYKNVQLAKDELAHCVNALSKGFIDGQDKKGIISEFLLLSGFVAYFSLTNTDIERLTESKFGYATYPKNFSKALALVVKSATPPSEATLVTKAGANLLSVIRDVSASDYCKDCLFLQDLANMKALLEPTNQKGVRLTDSKLSQAIAQTFAVSIEQALGLIEERYRYLLEGTFGVDMYAGVYTGLPHSSMQGISDSKLSNVADSNTIDTQLSRGFGDALGDYIDYKLYSAAAKELNIDHAVTGRQFDKDLIINYYGLATSQASSGKFQVAPLYFPYKVLEIIGLCGNREKGTLTTKAQLLYYHRLKPAQVGTLNSYLEKLKKFFTDEIFDFTYGYIFSYCQSNFRYLPEVATENKDDILKFIYALLDDCVDEEKVSNAERIAFIESTQGAIAYYCSCVTTAVVLDKFVTKEDSVGSSTNKVSKLVDIRLKVCGVPKTDNLTNANYLHTVDKKSNNTIGFVEDNIDVITPTYSGNHVCIDLQYTFDRATANALPIFAYKALETLKERNGDSDKYVVNWSNILLGRTLEGALVTSNLLDFTSKIQLQKNKLHYIIAGSRAGKGVMCYNLFATGMASDMPIFYLDRKPDTSTVLKEMDENIFCVNGGDYSPEYDKNNHFVSVDDLSMFNCPSYLKDKFTTNSIYHDYKYMRALLLVLDMVVYADKYPTSPVAQKIKAACPQGLILVLDEFTNFTGNFLMPYFSATGDGWFGKALSKKGIKDAIDAYLKAINSAKDKLERKKADKKATASAIESDEAALEDAIADLNPLDLPGIYFAGLAISMESIFRGLNEKLNAAGGLSKMLQIFVIGQNLNDIQAASNAYAFKKKDSKSVPQYGFVSGASTTSTRYISSGAIHPLITYFGQLQADAFIGYNQNNESYLAQKNKASKASKYLNLTNRCFAYKSLGTSPDFSKITAATPSDASSWIYFKPYMILNNSVQPPRNLCLDNWGESPQARNIVRMGQGQGGTDYQYVGQCITAIEEAHLTWDTLVSANTTGRFTADGDKELHPGVGFQGYMSELAPNGVNLGISGELMNTYVKEVYGYKGTVEQFLCDFSPAWFINCRDTVDENFKVDTRIQLQDTFFNKRFAEKVVPYISKELGSFMRFYNDGVNLEDEDVANSFAVSDLIYEDLTDSETTEEPSEPEKPTVSDMSVPEQGKVNLDKAQNENVIIEPQEINKEDTSNWLNAGLNMDVDVTTEDTKPITENTVSATDAVNEWLNDGFDTSIDSNITEEDTTPNGTIPTDPEERATYYLKHPEMCTFTAAEREEVAQELALELMKTVAKERNSRLYLHEAYLNAAKGVMLVIMQSEGY